MNITLNKILFGSAIVALGIFAATTDQALGQEEPIFWITWNADSYSTPGFLGKDLPINNTFVNVAFELVQNGKIISLSSKKVQWFLDEVPVRDGLGVKEYSFRSSISSGAHSVRIELPNYKNGTSLTKNIKIPVTSPEVVLDSPYIKNAVTSRELTLRALPYYFNVTRSGGLFWNWKVNNDIPTGQVGDPDKITITIPPEAPPGSQVLVKARVANSTNSNESAETLALFTIK